MKFQEWFLTYTDIKSFHYFFIIHLLKEKFVLVGPNLYLSCIYFQTIESFIKIIFKHSNFWQFLRWTLPPWMQISYLFLKKQVNHLLKFMSLKLFIISFIKIKVPQASTLLWRKFQQYCFFMLFHYFQLTIYPIFNELSRFLFLTRKYSQDSLKCFQTHLLFFGL